MWFLCYFGHSMDKDMLPKIIPVLMCQTKWLLEMAAYSFNNPATGLLDVRYEIHYWGLSKHESIE